MMNGSDPVALVRTSNRDLVPVGAYRIRRAVGAAFLRVRDDLPHRLQLPKAALDAALIYLRVPRQSRLARPRATVSIMVRYPEHDHHVGSLGSTVIQHDRHSLNAHRFSRHWE